jgi:outer membrane protein OmpA-like peptidoglycan-associated protein
MPFRPLFVCLGILFCCGVQITAQGKPHITDGSNVVEEPKVQWASRVVRVTSQKSNIGAYSSVQLLGKPNILSRAGMTNPCSWASGKDNNQIPVSITDNIRVGFTVPVAARQVAIAENVNPGAITAVIVRGSTPRELDTVYRAQPKTLTESWRMLNIFFEARPYKVSEVEIVMNVGLVAGVNEIDAIALSTSLDTVKPEINLLRGVASTAKAENLGKAINSEFEEVFPIISTDGKTLYFCRKQHPDNIGIRKEEDIWYSEMIEDSVTHVLGWGKAQNIGAPLNNSFPNFVCGVLPDGNTMLVGNVYLPNGSVTMGVSLSQKTTTGWGMPTRQVIQDYHVNNKPIVNYSLASDGKTLLMALDRSTSIGGMDLFVSFMQGNGKWSPPLNLGRDINTAGDESTVFLAGDGMTLYFSSDGHNGYGSNDIFMSRRLDSTWTRWSEPQNLGPTINSSDWDAYFSLPASGEFAYFVSEKNSLGGSDIFRIVVPESLRPRPVVLISGRVLDARTKKPLGGATIRYESLTTGRELGVAHSDSLTGKFQISLPAGELYGFRAEAERYASINENIDLRALQKYQELKRDLRLVQLEKGQSVVLNNIFFETGKWDLKSESDPELKRVVEMMQRNPSMKITIAGFTDNVGTKKNNIELSRKRAESVFLYLDALGIDRKRVATKGFGTEKPIGTNDSEEGRQQNRRVEFIIESVSISEK